MTADQLFCDDPEGFDALLRALAVHIAPDHSDEWADMVQSAWVGLCERPPRPNSNPDACFRAAAVNCMREHLRHRARWARELRYDSPNLKRRLRCPTCHGVFLRRYLYQDALYKCVSCRGLFELETLVEAS